MSEIKKEIDLSELPRKRHGKNERIDWMSSVGRKCKFVYDDIKGEIEIISYDSKKGIFTIIYNDKISKITRDTLTNCYFGKLTSMRTNEFKAELNYTFKDYKRDITIIDREYREIKGITYKWYKYRCNVCKYEGWIVESSLIRGSNCVCCTNQILVEGINDVATTHPHLVKYFANPDDAKTITYGSGTKVNIKCQDCGYIKKMRLYNLYRQGVGCQECSDGIKYPNKFIYSVLNQLNIEYIKEYHTDWSNGRFYDVYVPSLNLIIEMDGGLGHGKKIIA